MLCVHCGLFINDRFAHLYVKCKMNGSSEAHSIKQNDIGLSCLIELYEAKRNPKEYTN